MKMETPGALKMVPPKDVSPSAVRPAGSEPERNSIENDIRDAVGGGLTIQGSEASPSDEGQFGTTS
jgi:hypothetical protein